MRIENPNGGFIDITFSHMEAGNTTNDKAVRAGQLEMIGEMLRGSLGPAALKEDTVLFLGDTNIDGRPQADTCDPEQLVQRARDPL